MAIQQINLGSAPSGAGGDTQRAANTKINENFSNTTHAASRLVGTATGNLIEVGTAGLVGNAENAHGTDASNAINRNGIYNSGEGWLWYGAFLHMQLDGASALQIGSSVVGDGGELAYRTKWEGTWKPLIRVYSSKNTKKDSNTNLLLASGDTIPSTSAASRLVGTGEQEIPLNKDTFRGAHQKIDRRIQEATNASDLKKGERVLMFNMQDKHPKMGSMQVVECHAHHDGETINIYRQHAFDYTSGDMAIRVFDNTWKPWALFYTDRNTNKGTNGVLSEKSPVTHLYHDRLEHTGDEKELQPIKFVKQGVGDYLLKNTTGLAQEGWYIVIPHDANGNPLIAVEYDDNDGDVNIRTYKRKFDYEQAKVVADHDNPMDIPETRWIDLRFNDDPSLYEDEVTDEPFE